MKFVCFFLSYFIYLASSFASDKVNEIGKIIYSNENRSYYFIYLSDNDQVVAHRLRVKNKAELVKLKQLQDKSIRLEGELDWKRGSTETFSLQEEIKILKLEIFELNLLAFDSRKIIQQDNLISYYREPKRYQSNGGVGIPISDTTANSLISGAAVAVGVAAGPMSLIPAALFGIYQMFL